MTDTNNTSDWYKDAIIYQVHVRSYYDSNGDGIGDFPGLIEKLPYIEFLGVNTIWLLPFYPSPLKDEGYDIADYMTVNPIYGTLNDFKSFLKAAKQRNIKVITELVINHTSDQHQWFKKSRTSKEGSPWRDYYVWSNTPDKFTDARIIFRDFETSNWAWDPVANAYYWHRFYSHQPDLNYDNPVVQKEIFRIVDFWLGMGVDGLRLDAIPYLFQREGTNCENLPETHQFLKKLNHHINRKFKNKFLLAEANQWPEDAVKYFGDGDECQMAFHFPLMPRMYMAVQMEDRFPIIDIIEQTPHIPESCQWAIFLRNHDELTLEMVTDEERDYMYRMYSKEPQMRINLGIRRRLAPLMEGDRRKIELLNAFLFSLPGTPVIYYGDEIGMGDNYYLGDRNGVRTPMQWSNDNNAGFSESTPQKLYLPVIIDPEYNYQFVNVKLQRQNSQSMLYWMKKLIERRSNYQAFSRGSIEFLHPDNNKIIAFYRTYEKQKILVLINLSRYTQSFNLDLSAYSNYKLIEAFGRTAFPAISDNPYFFVLCPYGFLWLELSEPVNNLSLPNERKPEMIHIKNKWSEALEDSNKKIIERALMNYLPHCRWYRSKNTALAKLKILDTILFKASNNPVYLTLIEMEFVDKSSEQYFIFLTSSHENMPDKTICHIINKDKELHYLIDAIYSPEALKLIFKVFSTHKAIIGDVGSLEIQATAFSKKVLLPKTDHQIRPLDTEQSNTSIIYDQSALMKIFRLAEPGINPEVEINKHFTNQDHNCAPKLLANINYRHQEKIMTLAIIQEYVANHGTAWDYSLNAISKLIEYVDQDSIPNNTPIVYPWNKLIRTIPDETIESFGVYAHSVRSLAQKTAQMHLALSTNYVDKQFEPEQFSLFDQRSLYQSLRNSIVKTTKLMSSKQLDISKELQDKVLHRFKNKEQLLQEIQYLLKNNIGGKKIRCHGDFHLGQILYTGNDFIIIDYEGEPGRPLSERKIKYPPLKDIAGILRSFHYALYTELDKTNMSSPAFNPEEWYSWICHVFIDSYLSYPNISSLMPKETHFSLLLKTYMLEKVLYEIEYEINNRPDWIKVPCIGLIDLLE